MIRFRYNLLSALLCVGCAGVLASCEEEENYTEEYDLFRPRIIDLDANSSETEALVEGNSIRVAWYAVNDAVSYTVEACTDQYYNNRFAIYEVTEPSILMDDIPYGTTYYIRVRSNAAESVNNSQWATLQASTPERENVAEVLQDIDVSEDNEITITWDNDDPANPVDSISIEPMVSSSTRAITRPAAGDSIVYVSISRYLTEEERASGTITVSGLTQNTLYAVDLYDTSKPRRYDKPYNQLTFRTTGPAVDPIEVSRFDDLSTILQTNDSDPTIPEGVEYHLPAGSYYQLQPFSIQKGFKLVGPTEGDKPQIELASNWNVAAAASSTARMTIDSFEFENIDFLQTIDAGYFFNSGNSFEMNLVSFKNCTFRNFRRGFWRHQGSNYKRIGEIRMENCMIDQCFGHTGPYGTFAVNNEGDNIESVYIINCTFMREADAGRARNVFDHGTPSYPIHFEMRNVTFYNYCDGRRMVDLNNSGAGSVAIFENVLIASNAADLYRTSGNTERTTTNIYGTSEYTRNRQATILEVGANDLFRDPTNGDLTITDPTSIIVELGVGDPRWLP